MIDLFENLFRHEAWADAMHWKALQATPGALESPGVRDRLQHIHMVGRGFVGVLCGASERPPEISEMDRLRESVRAHHRRMAEVLARAAEEGLERSVWVPWVRLDLPVRDALIQMAMHSQYHRGQNALRIRELGGEPPLTDYIVWVRLGRPDPDW
jgi:uncharacterized damage-inducible protein DinB